MRLLCVLSLFVSGCATAQRYSGPYTMADKIIHADKIDVAYIGKNHSAATTVKSWPEAFEFIGHSIATDGK